MEETERHHYLYNVRTVESDEEVPEQQPVIIDEGRLREAFNLGSTIG